MIKTQVQIPDELFERAKRVAAAKEWSFAEIVRRGLEQMTLRHPLPGSGEEKGGWKLPAAVDLGLTEDPFADEGWREEANLVARFGDAYRDYAGRTGRFAPRLRT